jgi:hypothetical protein
MGWVSNHYAYLIPFIIFVKTFIMKKMSIKDGLEVRNGRLVNNRPDGMTGIQLLCEAKKMRKREQKIEMMVEADVRASMRERMLGLED